MEMNETRDAWETKENSDITLKVREAQVQQLFKQTWGGLVGTLFIAISSCVILWQVIPQWKLWLWVGVLFLFTSARGFLNAAFQQKAPVGAAISRWAKLQVIGVVASGLMWALPPLFLWPNNSPLHQLVWPICISALSAVAVAKYCIWTPAYLSFLFLSMVPLSLRLLAEGGLVYTVLGFLGFVFIAILAQTGKVMHTANLRALEVGLRNESLSSFLSDGKAKVEELNAQLQLEIAERTRSQQELRLRNQELEQALIDIRQLSGMLPICASCKKIRNDGGYWEQIEAYIQEHSEVEFSHGICPDCAVKLYPDFFDKRNKS